MQPIANYIEGRWSTPDSERVSEVMNPATAEVLGTVPLDGGAGAVEAVEAAERAFPEWRRTPAGERIQYLFRFKQLLEDNFDDIARTTTLENGKTLAESRGELRRGIENVEVACGIPTLMQGYNLEDIAPGIDEIMIRQPLGVVAVITPFNFPAMIPLWFLPYALACGNTLVLKPSEKVPLTVEKNRRSARPSRLAVRCRQRGQRRQGGSRCAARSPGGSRGQLRGLDAGGEIHLCPRGGAR